MLLIYVPLAYLLPLAVARALFVGGLLGYVAYDLTHYYIHHGSPLPGSYLASMKAYHTAHHYSNHKQGQGVGPAATPFLHQILRCWE